MNIQNYWTELTAFPSPLTGGYLFAPFGPGVYELRNIKTNELIYVGEGGHVAYRMCSLLPEPYGKGTRDNYKLRQYVLEYIEEIHYRTLVCFDKKTAKKIQNEMIMNKKYLFN